MKSHTRPVLVFVQLAVNLLPAACLAFLCLLFIHPGEPAEQPFQFFQRKFGWPVWLFIIGILPFSNIYSQPAWQPDQVRFLTIDGSKGLGNPVVQDIYQDAYGFVWIGTDYGTYRFDGYECTPFQVEPGTPGSISSNSITHHAFCEDEQGEFWIATSNAGLNRFNRFTQQFVQYNTNNNCLSMDQVTEILPDGKGGLWIATLGIGLNHLDIKQEKLTVFHDPLNRRNHFMGNGTLVSLCLDSKNKLWIGTIANASYFDTATGTFRRFWPAPDKAEGLSADFIPDILEDRQGNIWLASEHGLNLWHEEGYFEKFYPAQFVADHSSAFNYIKELLEDREGNLWLGTLGGLIRMDRNKHFEFFPHDPTDPYSIRPGPIHALMEDRDGNIWVGTNYGVSILNKYVALFNQAAFSQAQAFFKKSNISVFSILDAGGHLYFSTSHGVYRQTQGEPPILLLPGSSHSLFQDKNGSIHAGIFEQGLYVLDARTGQTIRRFPCSTNTSQISPDTLAGPRINATTKDYKGYFWIGTFGCLNRFDPVVSKVQHFSKKAAPSTGLVHSSVSHLITDHQNNLWIATLGGLDLLTAEELAKPFGDSTLQFEHFQHLPNDNNSISSNSVYTLLEDQYHQIWAGTETGLNCYNPAKNTWKRYFVQDGLPGNKVVALVQDDHGNIWLSTSNNGIARFKPGEKVIRFEKFTTSDGLHSDLFNPNACLKTSDGLLAFGCKEGVVAFHPDNLDLRTEPLPLYLIDFQLSNKSVVPEQGSVLPKPAWLMERFELRPQHKIFTFRFSSLNFINPEKLQYRYLLTLPNKKMDTVFLGSKREVTFTNLPSGKYTLRMQSSMDGFDWSHAERSFQLMVHPPWHRTWWAYLLYTITAAGLLYFLRRYELNRQLARAEARRLHELDQVKNRLYTNITHEFRTPLTLILGIADKLKPKVDYQAREELGVVTRNGRQLLDLVNQMLDLSKLESGSLALRAVQGDVVVFVKYLLESFHSLASQKNIRLHWESPLDRFVMDYDPVRLQQIVANLLSNALKFTPEGGSVTLSLLAEGEREKERLRIAVTDTGRGIPADKIGLIFERFYQVDDSTTRTGEGTGIGLTLARELARLHGGDISVQSTPSEGSAFTVLLPVSRHAPAAKVPAPFPEEIPVRTNGNGISTFATGKVAKPSLLVIEDNPDLTLYLASLLGHDYRIRSAPNGKAGLDRAQQDLPDVIISDVMMPEMDGYEVCRRLKDDLATCHIPIILLTAKSDMNSKITGLEQGADAYLPKPFDEAELRVWLKKLLESRERLRQFYTSGAFLSNQENFLKPDAGLSGKDRAFLQQLQEKVEARFSNPGFTAEMLCGELHLGYHTCLRKVKALTGMNVSEYIQHVRINRAAQWLLEDKDRPVTEIAQAAGFGSQNYFNRAFREAIGCTPSEYRRRGLNR